MKKIILTLVALTLLLTGCSEPQELSTNALNTVSEEVDPQTESQENSSDTQTGSNHENSENAPVETDGQTQTTPDQENEEFSLEILSDDYGRTEEEVYYILSGQHTLLEGADPESFEILEDFANEHGMNLNSVAQDENFIYFNNRWKNELIKADRATFEVLDETYAKDKDQVFARYGYAYMNYYPLEGANPDTFEALGNRYGSDGEHVYGIYRGYEGYWIYEIQGADAATFEVLTQSVSKDKNSVYLNTETFEVPNAEYFELYENQSFAHDDEAIYYLSYRSGKKLEGVDMNSFQIITNSLIKDKNYVYYIQLTTIDEVRGEYDLQLIPLEGIDPETFEYLGDWTYQDVNGQGVIDPNTL